VQEAFRTGGGVAWREQSGCILCPTEPFFRPGYQNNLVQQWLTALEGVVAKLERGAEVTDVGGGYGWSTETMAKVFPRSRFAGSNHHEGSVEAAHAHAREHGVEANACIEAAIAKGVPAEGGFDLVTFFDCLHDMGDPAGVAAHCDAR
jgi:2-polyprenyl-3-methyl-5-hydroxy-6-metoxy-1,4-benzoquinol methylase